MKKILLSLVLLSSSFAFGAAEEGGGSSDKFPDIGCLIEKEAGAISSNIEVLESMEQAISSTQIPERSPTGKRSRTSSILNEIEKNFATLRLRVLENISALKDNFSLIDDRADIHRGIYAKRTHNLGDFNDLAARQFHIDFTKEFAPEAQDQEHEDAFWSDYNKYVVTGKVAYVAKRYKDIYRELNEDFYERYNAAVLPPSVSISDLNFHTISNDLEKIQDKPSLGKLKYYLDEIEKQLMSVDKKLSTFDKFDLLKKLNCKDLLSKAKKEYEPFVVAKEGPEFESAQYIWNKRRNLVLHFGIRKHFFKEAKDQTDEIKKSIASFQQKLQALKANINEKIMSTEERKESAKQPLADKGRLSGGADKGRLSGGGKPSKAKTREAKMRAKEEQSRKDKAKSAAAAAAEEEEEGTKDKVDRLAAEQTKKSGGRKGKKKKSSPDKEESAFDEMLNSFTSQDKRAAEQTKISGGGKVTKKKSSPKGKEPDIDTLREAGAISQLVPLLESDDVVTKRLAAGALWDLAEENFLAEDNLDNQNAIRVAGAIRPLVTLLGSDDVETKQYATGALGNLAKNNPDNQDAIREAGAIPQLVTLLGSDDVIVKRNAAAALWDLAEDNLNNQNVIIANINSIEGLKERIQDKHSDLYNALFTE